MLALSEGKKPLSEQNKRFRAIQRAPRRRLYYVHTCCGQPFKRVGRTPKGLTVYECRGCGRKV